MKILVVTSGRIKGNTHMAALMLVSELAALAEKDGKPIETDYVALGGEALSLCRGCRACFEKGEDRCPLKDAAAEIASKMRAADAVILASPVYVEDVSGSMKNFIDRMAYNCYRQSLAGKTAYALTTSGVGSTRHALKTMTGALGLWGCILTGGLMLRMGERMREEEFKLKHGQATKAAAKKIYAKLVQAEPRPSLRSLIVFRVQQESWRKQKEQSITKQYWTQRGWLDKGCTYYAVHSKNIILTAIARMAGRIVALFFV